MSMTDPIADYLTKFKQAISEILKKSSFIEDFKVIETEGKFKMLSLKLKYNDGESVILGLKRISKPGIRRYVSNEDIPRVRNGLGISIVSTSKGLLTDKEARSLKVGGEVVCEIW